MLDEDNCLMEMEWVTAVQSGLSAVCSGENAVENGVLGVLRRVFKSDLLYAVVRKLLNVCVNTGVAGCNVVTPVTIKYIKSFHFVCLISWPKKTNINHTMRANCILINNPYHLILCIFSTGWEHKGTSPAILWTRFDRRKDHGIAQRTLWCWQVWPKVC